MGKVRAENFITVQGWMVTDLNLKGNELLLYALVYGFSQDEGSFSGGLQYVMDWLGCSKPTAIATLKSLSEKGFIERNEQEISGVKVVYYRCKNLTGGKETLPEVVKNFNRGGKKTLPNNKYINKNINNNPPISPQGDETNLDAELNAQRFESFWRMYPNKKAKQNARKAWDKLKVDGRLYTTIMRGLALHIRSRDWIKDDGQFVPHPATWLNGRRWEDEVEVAAPTVPERPQPKKLTLRR